VQAPFEQTGVEELLAVHCESAVQGAHVPDEQIGAAVSRHWSEEVQAVADVHWPFEHTGIEELLDAHSVFVLHVLQLPEEQIGAVAGQP
jgi:hypothetical protein